MCVGYRVKGKLTHHVSLSQSAGRAMCNLYAPDRRKLTELSGITVAVRLLTCLLTWKLEMHQKLTINYDFLWRKPFTLKAFKPSLFHDELGQVFVKRANDVEDTSKIHISAYLFSETESYVGGWWWTKFRQSKLRYKQKVTSFLYSWIWWYKDVLMIIL